MSRPHYTDGRVTVWHGDALAVLRELPSGSVDALITDPPYSSGGAFRSDRSQDVHSKYVLNHSASGKGLASFGGDNRDQRGYAYWSALWLGECLRIVKPGGVVCLFSDWRQLPVTTDALQAGGFVWRGIVPWWKPSSRPTMGRFRAACEYVVWGSKGPMPLDREVGALPGFYQASPPRNRQHVTQKPLDVMREIVRIVPAGGVILDPFAGAGTTGAAAVLEGYRFVGVELTEHFADVTVDRIREAVEAAASPSR